MRQLINFNVLLGLFLGLFGFLGAILAKRFQAGIAGSTYTPTVLARVIVSIIMISVGFGFAYAGLGSPPELAPFDFVAKSILDMFFITAAVMWLHEQSTGSFIGVNCRGD